MDSKDKAIAILTSICFILLAVLMYVVRGGNIDDSELNKRQRVIDSLNLEIVSLREEEKEITDVIDSNKTEIEKETLVRYEVKYIYRDAKINLFTISSDSAFSLFADNLSQADSIRR